MGAFNKGVGTLVRFGCIACVVSVVLTAATLFALHAAAASLASSVSGSASSAYLASYCAGTVLLSSTIYFCFVALAGSWVLSAAKAESGDVGSKTYLVIKTANYGGLLLLEVGFALFVWAVSATARALAEAKPSAGIHASWAIQVIPWLAIVMGLFVFGYVTWRCCPPASQRRDEEAGKQAIPSF